MLDFNVIVPSWLIADTLTFLDLAELRFPQTGSARDQYLALHKMYTYFLSYIEDFERAQERRNWAAFSYSTQED
jgi:hypothetical protein